MALKSPPLLPCPFFKTSEDHRRGQARAFYGLISQGRFDLIRKYIETYRDAGFLDGEIEQAEERRAELNMFAVENLMELRGYYAMNPFVEVMKTRMMEMVWMTCSKTTVKILLMLLKAG